MVIILSNENYIPIYPVLSDVKAMVKYEEDDISTDLFNTSMKNADGTIQAELLSNRLPIFNSESNNIPLMLTTAGNYFAVSDIHQALDGTDDRSSNEEGYYEKGMRILNAYIQQMLDELATTDLKMKSPYASSKSPSADQLGIRRRPRI